MSKIKILFLLVFSVLLTTTSYAQMTYRYSKRAYFSYSKATGLTKDSEEKTGSTLIINDKKREIQFRIDGINDVAIYDKLIIKGIVNNGGDISFMHYVYKDKNNDELHFFISEGLTEIQAYGSMMRLFK